MKKLIFQYVCYGLKINSALEFYALPQHNFDEHEADINIIYGNVPEVLINAKKIGLGLQVSDNCVLLSVHNIARYLICNGNTITIHCAPNIDIDSIKNFLISNALPYLLEQRGLTVLRGASFTHDEKNVNLIIGASGAGKSTVVTHLCQKGCKLLSDQWICIQKNSNSHLSVLPEYPMIKVWKDAAIKLKLSNKNLIKARPNIERYYYQIKNSNIFYSNILPIKYIFFLRLQLSGPEKKILPLKTTGLNLPQILHAWDPFLNPGYIKSDTMQTMSHLLDQNPIAEICRMLTETTINKITTTILSSLKQH